MRRRIVSQILCKVASYCYCVRVCVLIKTFGNHPTADLDAELVQVAGLELLLGLLLVLLAVDVACPSGKMTREQENKNNTAL